jgi:hypothetical protein
MHQVQTLTTAASPITADTREDTEAMEDMESTVAPMATNALVNIRQGVAGDERESEVSM